MGVSTLYAPRSSDHLAIPAGLWKSLRGRFRGRAIPISKGVLGTRCVLLAACISQAMATPLGAGRFGWLLAAGYGFVLLGSLVFVARAQDDFVVARMFMVADFATLAVMMHVEGLWGLPMVLAAALIAVASASAPRVSRSILRTLCLLAAFEVTRVLFLGAAVGDRASAWGALALFGLASTQLVQIRSEAILHRTRTRLLRWRSLRRATA